jgi:hypothetical protein
MGRGRITVEISPSRKLSLPGAKRISRLLMQFLTGRPEAFEARLVAVNSDLQSSLFRVIEFHKIAAT